MFSIEVAKIFFPWVVFNYFNNILIDKRIIFIVRLRKYKFL